MQGFNIVVVFTGLILAICCDFSDAGACSIAVHVNVHETIVPDSGSCSGQSVDVTINNAYRAYCKEGSNECESSHYAYHGGSKNQQYKTCYHDLDNDDTYDVVKHQNVGITCGDTDTTIDLYYINATTCACTILIRDYAITM